MRKFLIMAIAVTVCAVSVQAQAKISEPVWQAIEEAYRPAVWSEQLESAHKAPDPSKFRSFVVVIVGGMAAERAERFISWGKYDYRGVKLDLADGSVKNRRGKVYTYLQPGDVMAVVDLKKIGNTISMKLMSPDVYMPLNREKDKKFSRVTNTVQVEVPKALAAGGSPDQVLLMMSQYLKPFPNMQMAERFASTAKR